MISDFHYFCDDSDIAQEHASRSGLAQYEHELSEERLHRSITILTDCCVLKRWGIEPGRKRTFKYYERY